MKPEFSRWLKQYEHGIGRPLSNEEKGAAKAARNVQQLGVNRLWAKSNVYKEALEELYKYATSIHIPQDMTEHASVVKTKRLLHKYESVK